MSLKEERLDSQSHSPHRAIVIGTLQETYEGESRYGVRHM